MNNIESRYLDFSFIRSNLLSVVPQRLYIPNLVVKEFIAQSFSGEEEKGIDKYIEVLGKELPKLTKSVMKLWDKKCSALSGGELRKMHLWIALCKPRDVLILDEPTIELDKDTVHELYEFIKNNSKDKITILISHDEDLATLSDKIIELGSQ